MKKIAAIYARLSREDEDKIDGKESKSIESQIKTLSDYANEHDIEIYKIYYDDGYSGSTQNRPDFKRLLQDCYAHKFNILLIKDISRLGRVLHQVGQLIEHTFPENNIRVISLNDGYDSQTYIGESIVLKNFLNAYYLKEFKKKCRRSLEFRAKTKHLNYYPRYGYRFDKEKKEQIDPYSSSIVKQIFISASQGKTTCQIAKELNDKGVLTRSRYATEVLGMKPLNKKPASVWDAEKVWEIIIDYEYCGHSLNLLKRDEPPILLRDTHAAIIDEELFRLANDFLKSRNTRGNLGKHLGHLLKDKKTNTNLTYCRSKSNPHNDYYHSKKGKYTIKVEKIHSFLYKSVMDLIEGSLKNSDEIKEIYKKRLFKNQIVDKAQLQSKLHSLNEEYSKLMTSFFDGKVNSLYFEKKSKAFCESINAIESSLSQYSHREGELAIYEKKFNQFIEDIKKMPSDNKLDIIEMAVSKVTFEKIESKKEIDIVIQYKFEKISN